MGAYTLLQSRKSPNRVFVGGDSGLSSMRWEGGKWIDEGRLANFTDGFQSLAEQSDGTLWAGSERWRRIAHRSPLHRHEGCKSGGSALPKRTAWGKPGICVAFAAGQVFVIPTPAKNILRWDSAARQIRPGQPLLLPLPDSDAQANLFELPNGDIWSVNESSSNQRQGMFCRQPDGTYKLDEESFRRLSRFDSTAVLSEPDGNLWIAGADGLVRFDRRVKPSGEQSFSVLVRRVSSGLPGHRLRGHLRRRKPCRPSALQPQFAAL